MNQRSIETQRDWETDISHNGRKTSLLHAGLARRPEGLEGRLLAGHQFNKTGEESTHRSQMNSLDSEYEAEGMPEDDEGKGKPSSSETKTDVFNGDADVADADYSFKRRRLC
ncbi:unnamed protein product [Durusdinium trenchii]|uniref:Uncharacterized protein n=1 Tax=Durusdinium trenchii TaxID=1381693 RepID=A0ABP0ILW0_9DINO